MKPTNGNPCTLQIKLKAYFSCLNTAWTLWSLQKEIFAHFLCFLTKPGLRLRSPLNQRQRQTGNDTWGPQFQQVLLLMVEALQQHGVLQPLHAGHLQPRLLKVHRDGWILAVHGGQLHQAVQVICAHPGQQIHVPVAGNALLVKGPGAQSVDALSGAVWVLLAVKGLQALSGSLHPIQTGPALKAVLLQALERGPPLWWPVISAL